MPSEGASPFSEDRVRALVNAARRARRAVAQPERPRLGVRGVLLYVLPVPLVFAVLVSLIQGEFWPALAAGGAFAAITAGASMNRRGMVDALAAPRRRFTRSLRLPQRYVAAAAVAGGTALAALGAVGQGVLVSLAFGALALLGFHLAYPLPPPREALGARERVGDRPLQRALEQAETRVVAIERAAVAVGNPELEERLERIAAKGRGILDLIAERPAELFRARKFLNVYLEGAERVAGRYVRTHRFARQGELEQNFRNVLAEIEAVFERQQRALTDHDVFDLDVQIEVLRKQLEREGLA